MHRRSAALLAYASMAALFVAMPAAVLPQPSRHERIERRRLIRRVFRDGFRDRRHASWPYCGKRHRARLGRQVMAGHKRAANGVERPAF